jgi:hypothetical protein
MTEQTQSIPAGYRVDAQGRLVPESIIPPAALLADDLVRDMVDDVRAVAQRLAALKRDLLAEVAEHVALVATQYGADISGRTGDVRLDSYDGTLRIERTSGRRVKVGTAIHAAEALVREYLDANAAGVPEGIRAIVDRTFRRNSKTGELNVSRLLDFVAVEIDDPRWREAQRAIRESLETDETVTYFRAYERADATQPWRQIGLDFSALAPAPAQAPAPRNALVALAGDGPAEGGTAVLVPPYGGAPRGAGHE